MGVVSARIPDEVEATLKAHGLRPAQMAQEHLIREARRLDAEARLARLREVARKPSKPVVELVREVRDER